MRLHRFYISQEIDVTKPIVIESPDLVHQIRRVFRLKEGDSIVVFNGTHFDYECNIDGDNKKSTIVSEGKHEVLRLNVVTSERSRFEPARNVYLCASVVKKDTFEWIVEKATELGVTHIIPVISERSEKKSLNESRLNKIAVEASEQSGRGSIPAIEKVMSFAECIDFIKKGGTSGAENDLIQSVAFHTEGTVFKSSDLSKKRPTAVFIGPEGGWSADEVEMFHKNGIPVLCLGDQVLRAETAVVAALSMVVLGE